MRLFKILLTTAFVAFFVACGSNEPKAVALKYEQNMLDGKINKVLPLINMPTKDPFCALGKGDCKELTAQEKQAFEKQIESKLLQMSAEMSKRIQAKGGFDRLEFISDNTEGNKSVVNLKIYFKDGSNVDDKVHLEKVSGDWKVNLK